jgi:lysophospholipase L1-like esterase
VRGRRRRRRRRRLCRPPEQGVVARDDDRWRRRIAVGIIAIALVLGACSTSDEATTAVTTTTRPRADAPVTTVPGAPPLAVVLGDSNSFLASREIRSALSDAGFTGDVRGISGSGVKDDLEDWFPAAVAVGKARPAVVVIALGTNDAVLPEDVRDFPARVELLLQAIGDVPVVWVTHTEAGGGRDAANEVLVNDVIRALPTTHLNVTVLDLAPLLAARPSLLSADKLHYGTEGRKWFAKKLAEAATKVAGNASP